jgi:predicted outer membrane protein
MRGNIKKLFVATGLSCCIAAIANITPVQAQETIGPEYVPTTLQFLQTLGSFVTYERRAGHVAQVMGVNRALRAFARKTADEAIDHGTILPQASYIGMVPVPTEDLTPVQDQLIRSLFTVKAADFDREYITAELTAAQSVLKISKIYEEHGQNMQIRQLAHRVSVNLVDHIDKSNKLIASQSL